MQVFAFSVGVNCFNEFGLLYQAVSPNGLAGNWSNYNSMEICYYNQESLGTYVKPGGDSSVNHQMKNSSTVFYSCDDLKRPIQVRIPKVLFLFFLKIAGWTSRDAE